MSCGCVKIMRGFTTLLFIGPINFQKFFWSCNFSEVQCMLDVRKININCESVLAFLFWGLDS